jgi:hypothetical protein
MERAVKKQKALKKMSRLALGCRSSRDSGGALLTLLAKQLRLARVFLLSVSWGKNPPCSRGPSYWVFCCNGNGKISKEGCTVRMMKEVYCWKWVN